MNVNSLTSIYGYVGNDALFTRILFVETRCTSKLLQGEMCQSLIDKMTRPIMKNMSVVAVAFNIPVSCVYNI